MARTYHGQEVKKMGVILNMAARELGISERTLDRWARLGRIKYTRTAGGWRLFDSPELARIKALRTKKSRGGK